MAITHSTTNIQSNVLAYEELQAYGFCRKQATVDNTAGTMKLGSVLYRTVNVAASLTVYGAWTEVDAAHLADAAITFVPTATLSHQFAVIIGTDEEGNALKTSQADVEVSATAKVVLLTKGTAMVRKQALVYTGAQTAGALANLVDAIELNMEQVIVVDAADAFDGTYSDVTAIS